MAGLTDVLANERTFLAYLRTALSFIAFGFVVARFALFTREISAVLHVAQPAHQASTIFGTAIALFGSAVGAYGGFRYVAADRAIASGKSIGLPTAVAVGGTVAVVAIGIVVGATLVLLRGG